MKAESTALPLESEYVELHQATGDYLAGIYTDVNGRYTFDGLAAGSYKVYFGYYSDSAFSEWFSNSPTVQTATAIAVSSGATTTANATLAPFGAIEGTVTGSISGEPLSNVSVGAFDRLGNYVNGTTTDENGSYSLSYLSVGTYLLEYQGFGANDVYDGTYGSEWWNNKPSLGTADLITVTAGQTAGGKNVVLEATPGISGTVTAAGGAPVEGVTVYAHSPGGQSDGSVVTDSSGAYRIGGLVSGSYTVEFIPENDSPYQVQWYNGATESTATTISLGTSEQRTGVNAVLQKSASISGAVTTTAGGPAVDASVTVQNSEGDYITTGFTDSSGAFTVGGLTSGSYVLSFSGNNYIQQYYNNKTSFDAADRVTVASYQQVTGKNAVLRTGGTISGTITGGSPAAGIATSVIAYGSNGSYAGATFSSSNGSFSIGGLVAGSYTLYAQATGQFLAQWYSGRTSRETADFFAVGEGASVSKSMVLNTGASIAGTLTGIAGARLVNAGVIAYPATGFGASFYGYTNSSGNYKVQGLPAGSYKLYFSADDTYAPEWYANKASRDSADPVTVAANQALTGISASLAAGATISGTVIDDQGVPQAGASIDALRADFGTGGRTTTDRDGNFTVRGLTAGSYTVSAFAGTGHVTQFYGNSPDLAGATYFTVAASQIVTGKNITVPRSATIKGTVKNPAGAPLSNTRVDAVGALAGASHSGTAYTDSSGNYQIEGLAPDQYKLKFSPADTQNYLSEWFSDKAAKATATVITVTAGQVAAGRNVVLAAGASIKGNVKNSAGANLANVQVHLVPRDGSDESFVVTDSTGNFSFVGQVSGSYTLGAIPVSAGGYLDQWSGNKPNKLTATYFTVGVGQAVTGKNFVLVTGGSVSGTVKGDAATPVTLSGAFVEAIPVTGGVFVSTTADSAGAYVLKGLPTGTYKLKFTPRYDQPYVAEYYNDKATLEAANTVTVTNGSTTTGKNVVLLRAASISGTVTRAGTTTGVGSIRVRALLPDGGYQGEGVYTDSSGTFTLSGLTPGKVKLEATGAGYLDVFSGNRATLGTAVQIAVTSGATTTGVGLAITPGASISGTIKGADGNPEVGAAVSVYDSVGAQVGAATTGSTGQYKVAGLLADSYRLRFTPNGLTAPNESVEWYNNQSSLATATVVPVGANASVTNKNATLATGASIAGTVTAGTSSKPVRYVSVFAYDSADNFAGSASTDASGAYTLRGLTAGTYKLQFSAYGYAVAWYSGKTTQATANTITVTAGQVVTGKNATLTTGASISGGVLNSQGAGIPYATVTAFNAAGLSVGYSGSDSEGSYALTELPAGTYRLFFENYSSAYSPEYYNDKASLATADTITVTTNQVVTGKNVALALGASISGTVTGEGTPTVPIRYANVYVYDSAGGFVKSTQTDTFGSYSVTGLVAGGYKVNVRPSDFSTFAPQWSSGKLSQSAADTLTVTAGQALTGQNLTLVHGATISGTLSNAAGDKLDGIGVPVWRLEGSNYVRVGETVSNGLGAYSLPGLSAGTYKVGYTDYSTGNSFDGTGGRFYRDEFYNNSATLGGATPLTVTPGQSVASTNAKLELKSATPAK